MTAFLKWYGLISACGLAAMPFVYTWLRHLPDRGWGLARPAGWLFIGYLVWLFGFLGLTRVRAGSGYSVLLLVALGSLLVLCRWGGGPRAWWSWLRRRWRLVLFEELLFLAAFAAWTFYRAHDSAIVATEKPMEFAFLNSIVRGGTIPPADPWLSGFSISYYYFGYVLMGLVTVMSGVSTSVAFNLGIALLFALCVVGGFSLGYNLVSSSGLPGWRPWVAGVLALLCLVVIGNLEGLFEILHANGIGSAAFYEWLDIKNLGNRPESSAWYPSDHWWWWRASRLIRDRVSLTGVDQEVISEFPFFSLLLGDMHPHVLALPFVLLVLAAAFNLLRSGCVLADAEPMHWNGLLLPFDGWQEGRGWGVTHLLVSVITVASLGILNAWDFPTYGLIFVTAWLLGAVFVARTRRRPLREWAWNLLGSLAAVPILGIVCYLPFYIGFHSQVQGIGLVWNTSTSLHHYLIFFGVQLWVLTSWLAALLAMIYRSRLSGRWVLILCTMAVPLSMGILRQSTTIIVTAALAGLIWVVLDVCLWTGRSKEPPGEKRRGLPRTKDVRDAETRMADDASCARSPSLIFALLLSGVAMLLTLGTEFFYVRDLFGTRMNTVFKLYYQAWTTMSIAAAFGTLWLLSRRPLIPRALWACGLLLLIGASMIYPVAASWTKANRFAGKANLDGMAWLAGSADYQAIEWLNQHVVGQPTILEAARPYGAYDEYGRISTATGLPTLVGWGYHEWQWRGNYDEPGRREPIVKRIYQTTNPEEARQWLEVFDVRYVVVGDLERRTYDLTHQQVAKFRAFMEPVLEVGNLLLFER